MSPRPRLSRERVVDEAAALVDSNGLEALTLATLAHRLQVRTPSLYNHIASLEDLQQVLALRGLRELHACLQTAVMGRAGHEALWALSHAYRAFAHQHPGLYAVTQRSYEQSNAELQAAGRAVVEVVLAVLRGYTLADDEALHATRYLRSALHGFVSLELGNGFGLPLDVDISFEQLLYALEHSLHTWHT